jgi:hypothetical protein
MQYQSYPKLNCTLELLSHKLVHRQQVMRCLTICHTVYDNERKIKLLVHKPTQKNDKNVDILVNEGRNPIAMRQCDLIWKRRT